MDFNLLQKWEDFAVEIYISLAQFPKSEQFGIGSDLRKAVLAMGTYLTEAQYAKPAIRKRKLENADHQLQIIKTTLRLAKRLKVKYTDNNGVKHAPLLSFKRYEICSTHLVELGKMLGGWLKS